MWCALSEGRNPITETCKWWQLRCTSSQHAMINMLFFVGVEPPKIPTFLLVYGPTISAPSCLPLLQSHAIVWPRFSLGEWHRLSESFPRYLSAEQALELQRVADDSMAAYCILSQDAVANNLLLWPSRPKFHVSWMNVFLSTPMGQDWNIRIAYQGPSWQSEMWWFFYIICIPYKLKPVHT